MTKQTAPFPSEDKNDFRYKIIQLDVNGNVLSSVTGVHQKADGTHKTAQEMNVDVAMRNEGGYSIVVSPRIDEFGKKYNLQTSEWEDMPPPVIEKYTMRDIAIAIKNGNQKILDEVVAFYELDS